MVLRQHPSSILLVMALPLFGLASAKPVNDSSQAIRLAIAAWASQASQEHIAKAGPYSAVYRNGVWIVTVSRKLAPNQKAPEAAIRATDGQVLRASFAK